MDEDELIREQIQYYRARAPEYDLTSSPPGDPLARYGQELETALDRFRPMGRVLEIASGTGGWTVHLLRHASNITALDSSLEMHQLSRQKTGRDARVRYLSADVFSWEPDGPYDVVFFANWLSHVPPGRFDRFWETVRRALAPAGRVFFADELEDAWRYEDLSEDFVDGPSVSVVHRSLLDCRTFRVVKVFWKPEELRPRLRAVGWDVEIHPAGPFFWAEAAPRTCSRSWRHPRSCGRPIGSQSIVVGGLGSRSAPTSGSLPRSAPITYRATPTARPADGEGHPGHAAPDH